MMRKCINMPADDSVREWREWQLESVDIAKVEAEEKRLDVQNLIRRVQVLRGLGGGALIMGLPGELDKPVPATIGAGQLLYVHVVNRWQLTLGPIIDDPTHPDFGGPEYYETKSKAASNITIHPSRVIPFKGKPIPNLSSTVSAQDAFWGESDVDALRIDVENYEAVKTSLLKMISKAAYMRVGIPKLNDKLSATNGLANVTKRVDVMARGASTFGAVVFDAGEGTANAVAESVTDASISLAGVADIINVYAQQIAAVKGWPVTKVTGQASTGLNASGDGDQRDWNKIISAIQTLDIGPCLRRFDYYMLQSAGAPKDASYSWPSLSQPTQKEDAERMNIVADIITKLQQTALIPDEALSAGIRSLLEEEGIFPGLGDAWDELPDDIALGIQQGDPHEPEPDAEI
jgi:phage-related protein (TIGR01555 family)